MVIPNTTDFECFTYDPEAPPSAKEESTVSQNGTAITTKEVVLSAELEVFAGNAYCADGLVETSALKAKLLGTAAAPEGPNEPAAQGEKEEENDEEEKQSELPRKFESPVDRLLRLRTLVNSLKAEVEELTTGEDTYVPPLPMHQCIANIVKSPDDPANSMIHQIQRSVATSGEGLKYTIHDNGTHESAQLAVMNEQVDHLQKISGSKSDENLKLALAGMVEKVRMMEDARMTVTHHRVSNAKEQLQLMCNLKTEREKAEGVEDSAEKADENIEVADGSQSVREETEKLYNLVKSASKKISVDTVTEKLLKQHATLEQAASLLQRFQRLKEQQHALQVVVAADKATLEGLAGSVQGNMDIMQGNVSALDGRLKQVSP